MNSRKVMVVLELPEGQLLSCRLEDLGVSPQRGSCYTYQGRLYEVERVIEPVDVRRPDGSRKTSDEQLLELLSALTGDDQQLVVMRATTMRNIGSEDDSDTVKTDGGIIVSSASTLAAHGDQLVYLQLHLVRVVSNPALMFRQLAAQATGGKDEKGSGSGDGN